MRKRVTNNNTIGHEHANRKSAIPTISSMSKQSLLKQEPPKTQYPKTSVAKPLHGCNKTSPMRLKIIRSREASPLPCNDGAKSKVMGNVSIKKIRLVKGNKRCLVKDLKQSSITLCDSNPPTLRKPQITSCKSKPQLESGKYARGLRHPKPKHVELSFEEELDVENIYRDNSVLDQNRLQKCTKVAKHHKRKSSDFEDGLENLSSEGNEHDSFDKSKFTNQPKI